MRQANYQDKARIIDILAAAFDDNKSVNYIVRQDTKRPQRIRRLMDYSFDVCYHFGKVYMSDDNNACALIVLPDRKRTILRALWLDLKLIFTAIGFAGVKKAMTREARIKQLQPKVKMYYLWFIGVEPIEQGRGKGSTLLRQIEDQARSENRIVALETSTTRNLPWYEALGFTIYNTLDLDYKLFFLKKE